MDQETKQDAPGGEASFLFNTPRSEPKLAVGLKVFIEITLADKLVRTTSSILGWSEPEFMMMSIPQVENRMAAASPGADVVVRYLLDGTIYGFATRIVHKQSDPFPMWIVACPPVVETKILRRSPRINLSVPVNTPDGDQFHTIDLSSHGALLAVNEKVRLGQKLQLSFLLPDSTAIDHVDAEVVRLQASKEEVLAGVNFDDSAREQLDRIKGYLYAGPYKAAEM